MTDNHMVFFAEIAFIYGGNDSLEKDVFGSEKIIKSSERSSETTAISSGTGSGTHPHKILDTSGKDEHGDIHTTGNKRKTYILRFKFDFCEAVVKTRLEHS
jgi:hypothetical protein